jgi:hypothetical protein
LPPLVLNQDPNPLPVLPFTHNQNYYYNLFRYVCGENPPLEDVQMIATLQVFRAPNRYPQALDGRNLMAALAQEAVQCVQNLNEHIGRNLPAAFMRLLRHHEAVQQENGVTRKKLATHVYKRLAGIPTNWPTSVDRTQTRIDVCNAMVANYQEWFPGQLPRPEFHASEESIKANTSIFYPLFHRVLFFLEDIANRQIIERVAVPNPITTVPPEYIHNKLRTKLEYSKMHLIQT